MLEQLRDRGLLEPRGRARTDSTHILAAIRTLNRLECVGETLRQALNTLPTVAPDWRRNWAPSAWYDRYGRRFEEYRLPPGKAERYALAEQIGADGSALLTALDGSDAPDWLRCVPAVERLRQVWEQQFVARAEQAGKLARRTAEELVPRTDLIRSPYDVEARYAKKRQTEWTGYKVHLTETCDDEFPSLIINVETTPATTTDYEVTPLVQRHLAEHDRLPSEHLVDTGYMSALHLVSSAEQGIDLLGPVAVEKSWQAQAKGGYRLEGPACTLSPRTAQPEVASACRAARSQGPHGAFPLLAHGPRRLPGPCPMHVVSHLAAGLDHLCPAALRGAASGAQAPTGGVLAALCASGRH